MALEAGDITASFGMSKAIYEQLDKNLMTDDDKSRLKPDELKTIQDGWRKLAYALAQGIVDYLPSNLEIRNADPDGKVTVSVSGKTGQGGADNHDHSIDITAEENDVKFI